MPTWSDAALKWADTEFSWTGGEITGVDTTDPNPDLLAIYRSSLLAIDRPSALALYRRSLIHLERQ